MVTPVHEASHPASYRILPEHPDALAPVFEALQIPPIPKTAIHALHDTTRIPLLERCPGALLKIERPDGDGFLLAIEFQAEPDPDKPASWAFYLAHLHATYEMPVLLLVVCRRRTTASWAVGPFETRCGDWTSMSLRPLALGPQSIPPIVEEATAVRHPLLAALAAVAHSEDERIGAALDALAHGMRSLDGDTAEYLSELLAVGLEDTSAGKTWREDLREDRTRTG
ncbi:hypothetical protein Sipo8835_36740 [Streptomyces ipomoeae]|jgi:hypothetical protein|uniref:Transposase (putative) YhgA-like domain-containing protein n=2 Tax=Streptomyces ipomoeae TaxID=103232 RepID=L1KLD3_9ACTN|nr:hypothetical protein [Streptomyces ipomoeae]EKX61359.1 hypothetical protein STRIP9103_04905 [Streptomyces ipomoeae 91-03]MDX2700766.1 hypothetical protein [Streptomyces ipomoeae]MDX2828459.1 hypothetical protein [Streptomyces ipomoeae]MDX2845950.1 hypothetical protein [Streptomyces ipomoeae]MDX2880141.1 hypothetical protein [Streptomyces ipomoeae]